MNENIDKVDWHDTFHAFTQLALMITALVALYRGCGGEAIFFMLCTVLLEIEKVNKSIEKYIKNQPVYGKKV